MRRAPDSYAFMSNDDFECSQASEYPGFLHGFSASSVGLARTQSFQLDFFGDGTLPMNGSLLASGTGFEQNPIVSSHSTLNDSNGHDLTAAPPSDGNDLFQPSSPSCSSLGGMKYPVKIPDARQLATLTGSQLKDLAKVVAQAQALAKEKELKELANPTNHKAAAENRKKAKHGLKHKQPLLECRYPKCEATFRRNKDRTRHIRVKHEENPGFACPVVDCPMGTGHIVPRNDKLRDHLRGKAISSMTWRCVLPGCAETGVHKAWWFNHIKEHDRGMRQTNSELLINYGYKDFYYGYPWLEHLCTRLDCPFGTTSSADWNEHVRITHNGAYCPCPIPGCETSFKDWDAVNQHLAVDHNNSARRGLSDVLRSQGFYLFGTAFRCPVLSCGRVIWNGWYTRAIEIREHCQEHDSVALLSAAESLVKVWRFTFDGETARLQILDFNLPEKTSTNKQIFAYLAFSGAELATAGKPEDLDRLCLEKGIDLA
jgi:hypothetical protein